MNMPCPLLFNMWCITKYLYSLTNYVYIVDSTVFISLMLSTNLKLYIWYTSLSFISPEEGDAVRCWHKFIHKHNIGTKLVKSALLFGQIKCNLTKFLLNRQIIWWLYQCTPLPSSISTNCCYLSIRQKRQRQCSTYLHYSRRSLSAWIRLSPIAVLYLSLSLYLFFTYVYTIIHKHSCSTFNLEFLIYMWNFFDLVSSAQRNVSMESNISYQTDTRQATSTWKCGFVPTLYQ
jgi:hypothetical protein